MTSLAFCTAAKSSADSIPSGPQILPRDKQNQARVFPLASPPRTQKFGMHPRDERGVEKPLGILGHPGSTAGR